MRGELGIHEVREPHVSEAASSRVRLLLEAVLFSVLVPGAVWYWIPRNLLELWPAEPLPVSWSTTHISALVLVAVGVTIYLGLPIGIPPEGPRNSCAAGPPDGARCHGAVPVCSQSHVRGSAVRSTWRGDIPRIVGLRLVRARLVRVRPSQRYLVRGAIPHASVRRFVQALPIRSAPMDPWIAVSTSGLTSEWADARGSLAGPAARLIRNVRQHRMRTSLKLNAKIAVAVLLTQASVLAVASQSPTKDAVTITITEPAQVSLAELVRQADVVALVSILAGDTERYHNVVYRASVLQAFKGTNKAAVIYFGPFVGYRIGSEYVVALKRADRPLSKLVKQSKGLARSPFDDAAMYLQIMYDGYSVMAVDYTCMLAPCDYAVDVAYTQVRLPPGVNLTPNPGHNGTSAHGWVRKNDLLAALARLAVSAKP